jgi:hypothetical protein
LPKHHFRERDERKQQKHTQTNNDEQSDQLTPPRLSQSGESSLTT